ncbi:MAG: UDP-N-acetylmuramoyl-L-alanine--D-glutamate ligase [Clostridia bacterium]
MLINYVSDLIRDKNVCILGFGREGKSTYNLFKKAGVFKSITICDLNPVGQIDNVNIITGENYQASLNDFDIIMKSPGIVLEDGVLEDMLKIYSQTEIFLSVYGDRTVGVTGTKGKSTTSSLIYHVLNECGKSAVLLGNIGIPPFDGVINSSDTIVFELSSHQLEYTNVSPSKAVFLNIFPEHLDHYGTFEKYYDAKKNIYRYQKEGDLLVVGEGVDAHTNAHVLSFGSIGNIKIMPHSFIFKGDEITLDYTCPLLGSHNVNNIAAAYAVTNSFGVSKDDFLRALKTFKTLPHRLEKIGEKDGIIFYDDSISTIPQTTIQAVNALPHVGTLLIGGMDRGIDYSPLIDFLKDAPVDNVIFMYDTGNRIIEEFGTKYHKAAFHFARDLKEAVLLAKSVTPKGTICLLSPAAASYGFFKNFEDRGEKFKEFSLN